MAKQPPRKDKASFGFYRKDNLMEQTEKKYYQKRITELQNLIPYAMLLSLSVGAVLGALIMWAAKP